MSLNDIFKAYDIRGLVPEHLDADIARSVGGAFARFVNVPRIAVGHDCRESSPFLADAFIAGVRSQGVSVDDLGMITTDMLYYAAGALDIPGAMITASHNPKGYNGMKFCLAGAAPVGIDTGLAEIKALAAAGLSDVAKQGSVFRRDVFDGYVGHIFAAVDLEGMRPLRVAVDGGNGVAGVAVPRVFAEISAELIGLYLEPDGMFPNHHPDPSRPENLRDLEALMSREAPDLGVAFDGDADRAVFIDEQCRLLPGSTVTGIVAEWFLRREPGGVIVHNLICSKAVPELVTARGGISVRARVGHSFIKQVMADTGAVFGGEHSGHYYFRENFRADSGILTMLVLLQVLSEDGRPLSEIRTEYEPYAQSGEINFEVEQMGVVLDAVASNFPGAMIDRLDGLTIDFGDRWFNLRPSNTEPVLRLNAEAPDDKGVADLVAAVQAVIEVGL